MYDYFVVCVCVWLEGYISFLINIAGSCCLRHQCFPLQPVFNYSSRDSAGLCAGLTVFRAYVYVCSVPAAARSALWCVS